MEVLPSIYLMLQLPPTWLSLDAAEVVDFWDCSLDLLQDRSLIMRSAQQ
jgi:hypothetical protein